MFTLVAFMDRVQADRPKQVDPVLVAGGDDMHGAGVGEGKGNLPRGLYIVDGVYTMDISSVAYKAVNLVHGATDDLCARID
ncbi:hypothetical protein ACWEP4_43520 [Streptomyces sp. NPDC004227]